MWGVGARRIGSVLGVLAIVVAGVGCGNDDDDDASDEPTVDPTGHVGIPANETPEGLKLCFADDTPHVDGGSAADEDEGQVVLYGHTSPGDPYAGPMVGVFWAPKDEIDYRGDGDPTSVEVRNHDGVVAPMTVFQQTVLPELGTVVAWEERGMSVGVMGREWLADRTDQLVELADAVDYDDGRFSVPEDALPSGYEEVYSGPSASMSVLAPGDLDYWLMYANGDGKGNGTVSVYGLHGSKAEFEAFRFLARDLDRADLHGEDTITGNAWDAESGPAVVTWREPDGRIVRIVGSNVELPVITEFAQYTRQLTPEEWKALQAAAAPCDE